MAQAFCRSARQALREATNAGNVLFFGNMVLCGEVGCVVCECIMLGGGCAARALSRVG